MIRGTGVDMIEVGRVKQVWERFPDRFLEKLYTPREQKEIGSGAHRFEKAAGRFAAKEAVMKALGTGWRRGVRWTDVEIHRPQGGRPVVSLHGAALRIAKEMGIETVHISTTHTVEWAQAYAIAE